MAWFKRKDAPVAERKSFGIFSGFAAAGSMQRNAAAFAKEGYIENAVVAACVRLIADACASVELQIEQGPEGKVLESHPLLDLLNSPNGMQSGHELIRALVSHELIAGDAYVTRLPAATNRKAAPTELWVLEPSHVSLKTNPGFGFPLSYAYKPGAAEATVFPVNPITGYCDLVHIRSFNPLDPHRGLSPMQSGAFSIDTHNEALKWNLSLLKRSGRPSGAITTPTDADGKAGTLTDEQFQRLRSLIDEQFTGSANAGRPLILEGGLDWKEMSLSPKEMDFLSAVWAAAMHICMAYGVPPQMLGIPGSQTRANFEQADLTFWQSTILPTLDRHLNVLNRWLAPMYGDATLRVLPNLNSIPALEPQRQVLYDRAEKADFLTIDEKRAMVGLGPLTDEEKKQLLVPNTMIPLDMLTADMGDVPVEPDEEADPPANQDQEDPNA